MVGWTLVIVVDHLAKRYGDLQAVADVSFEVRQGEIFGLLGPNGAGKTTSPSSASRGCARPDAGRVDVLGLDPVHQASALRERIGAQLQESSLPQRLRVGEALALFSSFQGGGPPWRSVMHDWGLEAKEKAAFGSLSGGQRQRLLVALALVNDPQVVFLDEMTTGLDPAARRSTWELVERIRARGTTVVLVTHFMDEAERLCDRLAVVVAGRVVATGTPAELVAADSDGVTVTFTAAGVGRRLPRCRPGRAPGRGGGRPGVGARRPDGAAARREGARRPGHHARRHGRRAALARGRLPAARRRGGGVVTRVRALSMTELRLFLREPVTVLFTLALPLMVLYVLNGVFGQDQAAARPRRARRLPRVRRPGLVHPRLRGDGGRGVRAHRPPRARRRVPRERCAAPVPGVGAAQGHGPAVPGDRRDGRRRRWGADCSWRRHWRSPARALRRASG